MRKCSFLIWASHLIAFFLIVMLVDSLVIGNYVVGAMYAVALTAGMFVMGCKMATNGR